MSDSPKSDFDSRARLDEAFNLFVTSLEFHFEPGEAAEFVASLAVLTSEVGKPFASVIVEHAAAMALDPRSKGIGLLHMVSRDDGVAVSVLASHHCNTAEEFCELILATRTKLEKAGTPMVTRSNAGDSGAWTEDKP